MCVAAVVCLWWVSTAASTARADDPASPFAVPSDGAFKSAFKTPLRDDFPRLLRVFPTENHADPRDARLRSEPYELKHPAALFSVSDSDADVRLIARRSRRRGPTAASIRIRGQFGDDGDGVTAKGGSLLFTMPAGLGIDAEAHRRDQNLKGVGTNRFWTGDLNLVWQTPRNPRFSFRTGLGAAWLIDPKDERFGPAATTGFDFMFQKPAPFVLSTEFDYGYIDGDTLYHIRATGGFVYGPFEIFAGRDWYRLDALNLDAWIAGGGLWF